jgi:hypothetical protein
MQNESISRRVDPIPALKQQLGRALAELLKGGNADDVAAFIGTIARESRISAGES